MQLTNDIYFPMMVADPTESVDSKFQIWVKFRQLPEEKRDILVSEEITWKMKELQDTFRLSDSVVAGMSLLVRKIFFGELDILAAESQVNSLLMSNGSTDPSQVQGIVQFIKTQILTLKPAKKEEASEETPAREVLRLPLLRALNEYKHIAEQSITESKISVRGMTEAVRPSLANWLKSYREELGVGFHEQVDRGRFLFQSQNGKRLSNEERARLNLILKSIEEEFPLEIDPKQQVIIFPSAKDASMELAQMNTGKNAVLPRIKPISPSPAFPKDTKPAFGANEKPSAFQVFKPLFQTSTSPEKNVSGETLHFSTGHVLPAERETADQSESNEALKQMQHPTQGIKRRPPIPLSKSPYSIRPLRQRDENDSQA